MTDCNGNKPRSRVILNEVKNLDLSTGFKKRDPSAAPQDDIATQALKGEEVGRPTALSTLFYAALWRGTQRAWFRRSWMGAVIILCLTAVPISAAEKAQPAPDTSKASAPKEAPLVLWNQPITVFRSSFAGQNPQERAAQAAERIQALPLGSESAEIKFGADEDRKRRRCGIHQQCPAVIFLDRGRSGP